VFLLLTWLYVGVAGLDESEVLYGADVLTDGGLGDARVQVEHCHVAVIGHTHLTFTAALGETSVFIIKCSHSKF